MIMDRIALVLAIIGGLNWGSIGLFPLRHSGVAVRRSDRNG